MSLVFVQSRDGNTGANNPAELGGGPTDKYLIYEGLSRVAADGVMAGASTIGKSVFFSITHPQLVALAARVGAAATSSADRRVGDRATSTSRRACSRLRTCRSICWRVAECIGKTAAAICAIARGSPWCRSTAICRPPSRACVATMGCHGFRWWADGRSRRAWSMPRLVQDIYLDDIGDRRGGAEHAVVHGSGVAAAAADREQAGKCRRWHRFASSTSRLDLRVMTGGLPSIWASSNNFSVFSSPP